MEHGKSGEGLSGLHSDIILSLYVCVYQKSYDFI